MRALKGCAALCDAVRRRAIPGFVCYVHRRGRAGGWSASTPGGMRTGQGYTGKAVSHS